MIRTGLVCLVRIQNTIFVWIPIPIPAGGQLLPLTGILSVTEASFLFSPA